MAPTHWGIGHKVVQRGHGSGHQQQLQRIKAPLHRSGQRLHHPARGRHHVRRSGHTHAQQQRPQGQHPPVNEQSLAQRTQALHTPDVVQGFVHGQRQLNDRNHQKPQAHRPQLAGFAGKLQDVAHQLLGDGFRNQALHQPGLQVFLQTRKAGKGGEHRQQHGKKRHDGQQRGVGQAAGRQPQLVVGKTLAQHAQGVAPRKFRSSKTSR